MVQVLQANQVDLRTLIDNFGLRYVQEPQFFPEWREGQVEITDSEQQAQLTYMPTNLHTRTSRFGLIASGAYFRQAGEAKYSSICHISSIGNAKSSQFTISIQNFEAHWPEIGERS